MSAQRVVIVGGGPAGFAAARGYRAAGGTGRVTMLAGEPHHPYRRPPLTKEYLRGELDPTELPVEPAKWFGENDVRVVMAAPATNLDLDRRMVGVERLGELPFDRLVIATGARPARPPIDGADHPRLHTIRTVEDADALVRAAPADARVTVAGSGFIGCEAAASLALRGNDVTLLTDEPAPQATRLGDEVGERIAGWLRELGVTLHVERSLQRVETRAAHVLHVAPPDRTSGSARATGDDHAARSGDAERSGDATRGGGAERSDDAGGIATATGSERIEADVVVLALGIEPNVELAERAGLAIDEGRIACDASGATSAEGVFAAGDVARLRNPTAGRRLTVEHWGEALAQGEVAGRAAAGAGDRWDAVPGFWSTIGDGTLKQAAWGDGHDEVRLVEGDGGSWTAWFGNEGRCVGVLTHERDDDYERGGKLVAAGAPLP